MGESRKGYLNADRSLSNFGYFVRADYSPTEKLRLVAAIRGDDFNISDKDYLSYQLATSYNLSEDNLLRAVVSQANQGHLFGRFVLRRARRAMDSPTLHYVNYRGQ
jgi:iron complex outermembrane receptor protein